MVKRDIAKRVKVKRTTTTTRIKKKPMTTGERHQLALKTRSGFETKIVDLLNKHKVDFEYENKLKKVDYVVPEKSHKYLCDFIIPCKNTGVEYYFEAKGFLPDLATRMKYLYIQEQNPDIKLVMVFMNPNLKIAKASKTTYKDWFESKGIDSLDFKQFDKLMSHYNESGEIDLTILQY